MQNETEHTITYERKHVLHVRKTKIRKNQPFYYQKLDGIPIFKSQQKEAEKFTFSVIQKINALERCASEFKEIF